MSCCSGAQLSTLRNDAVGSQRLMRQLLLVVVQASAWAVTTNLQVGRHDFILAGGAGFVPGHGAPTGMALRSGSPGQTTAASFPQLVLAPGATVQEVAMSYRYVTGYGAAGSGRGSNLQNHQK